MLSAAGSLSEGSVRAGMSLQTEVIGVHRDSYSVDS